MRFALLVFYAAGTLWAAPVLDERFPKATINVIECSRSRFQQGTTFEYEYAGETINTVAGTTTQATGIQLTTSVLITQLKGCDFHMRLRGVGLRSKRMQGDWTKSAESTAFGKSLEKNDVIFTMEGPKITGIQSHESETTEALNIKRGILSTLQLDQTSGSETDVHGVCESKIVKKDGMIVKTKSLSSCSQRAQNEIGIQSASIKTATELKPLDSKSTCNYTMDSQTIRTASCKETHLFRPFSAGYESPSGAMTIVTQKMRFISYKVGAGGMSPTNGNTEKGSLIFDHTTEDNKQAGSLIEQVEEVMGGLVDQSQLSAKQTSAHKFNSLVMLFRKLSQNKMVFVWEKYFDCVGSKVCGQNDMNVKDLYRQYMLDAIAYCGTPQCVSVVKDVTISGEIAGERANMFLQSIALVAKTTNGMIKDVLDIVEKRPSRQAFMTLGTVISRHCAKSPSECDAAESPAAKAGKFLKDTLGDCTGQEDPERVEEILMVLKAIGNAKRPTNARDALVQCGKHSLHANVTMSAFDALRGMACNKTTLEDLGKLIADNSVGSEKRIYAFQASMKCPTKDNVQQLVQQFNLESDTQLTSFMWSFFTNILESTDPDMKEAKEVLVTVTKETPLKEANFPLYSHSKNFEKSLYLESIKTGVSAKANLVYDNKGILPKTAVVDVTAQVMGVPVDLVETAVGVDGVEALLENLVMPDNFVTNMFDWKAKSEKIKKMKEQAKSKKPTHPSGFMSMKVMGQEVRVMSYDDIYAMVEEIDNMNVIQLMTKVAKGGQKTFSKSIMFLEMTHTVPTGFGLPLKLKLTGTTVGTMELDGKFDIRNMFWGPGAMTIKGSVKPSAVVEVAGKMGIESEFISSGLLVSSNMIVSNTLKGSIDYKSGQLLKVNIDTPEKPVQLFKFSSTPYMYLNTQTDMIEGIPRMINNEKCMKSELIGYGLCTTIRVPLAYRNYESPYFPLSGPAYVGMSLVRGDEKLKTFQFLTTMTKTTTGLDGVIEFSTPGAVYERKLSGKMSYSDIGNDKIFSLSTEPFGKSASVEFIYNTLTRRTSLVTKNNFFNGKNMVARLVYFNQTNLVSQQYGIQASAEYDLYKFEHVTKYVAKSTGRQLLSKTTYAPNKAVTSSLEYNSKEKTISANFDINQLKQAIELTGKLENIDGRTGVSVKAVHKPSGKSANFFTGYSAAVGKKELMTSLTVLDNKFYNVLGWYKNGDVQRIEDSMVVNGKAAKFVAGLENKNGDKQLRFSADVFGKTASSAVLYSDLGEKKTIEVTVEGLEKRANSIVTLTNTETEKTIQLVVDALGKKYESTAGYYDNNGFTIFKFQCDILGRHAEVFWQLESTTQIESTFGAKLGEYAAGATSVFTNGARLGKSLCSYLYYGKGNQTKQAIRACTNLVDLGNENLLKLQLVNFIELPVLKKKLSSEYTLLREAGHVQAVWEVKHNDATKLGLDIDADYKDPLNTAITFDGIAFKLNGGMKVYTKEQKELTDFGVLLFGMGNSLLFLNQYQETIVPDAKDMKVTSSIVLNGNALPFSTVFSYMSGKGLSGPTVGINIGKYSLVHGIKYMYGGKYGLTCETMFLKEGQLKFRAFNEIIATVSAAKKDIEHTLGFSLMGRTYKYGWSLEYKNQSTKKNNVHVLSAKVQYATGRFSTSTLTFTDSDEATSLVVDVEYIPTRRIQHYIRYNKHNLQLDVSVEFLPEMFAKFMARLEKEEGYSLITTASLKWKDFSRSITVRNSYVNNEKEFKISTTCSKGTFIALKFNKESPKSLTFIAAAFGRKVELMGQIRPLVARILVTNGDKVIINTSLVWNKIISALTKEFNVSYQKFVKFCKLEYKQFKDICQLVCKELMDVFKGLPNKYTKVVSDIREKVKQWVSVDIEETKSSNVVKVHAMGVRYAKIIIKKKTPIIAVQLPNHVSVSAKYHSKSKSLSFTVKTRKTKATMAVRFDLTQKVGALQFFLNKKQIGMKVFIEKNSLIFKLVVTPKLTLKAIFTLTDNTVTMLLKRNNINETTMQFVFSKSISELVLKWNTETMKKLESIMRPLFGKTEEEFNALLRKVWSKSEQLKKITMEVRDEMLKVLKKMNKAFEDFDFVAAGKKVAATTLSGLKKVSGITTKSLNKLASVFDKIKKNMPEVVQKLKEWIKELKELVKKLNHDLKIKGEDVIAKIKDLIKKIKEIMGKGRKMMKTVKVSAEKEFIELKKVLTKVATDLTKSASPVIKKAIELLKDVKIRGKRMEDILEVANAESKKYIKSYVDKASASIKELKAKTIVRLKEMKVKIIEYCDKTRALILKLNVPYINKTVVQVIEIIKKIVTELQGKIKSFDMKKIVGKIMDYKINKKTIKQYVDAVQQKVNELKATVTTFTRKYMVTLGNIPESTRAAIRELIKLSRKQVEDIEVYLQNIENFVYRASDFAKPLAKYLGHVRASINTHFGPVFNQLVSNIIKRLKLPELAPIIVGKLRDVAALTTPLINLSKNILEQIGNFTVMGVQVGPMLDKQIEKIVGLMERIAEATRDKMSTKVKQALDKVLKLYNILKSETPEELADSAINSTMVLYKEVIVYLRKVYEEREVDTTKVIEEFKILYLKLKVVYEKLMSKYQQLTSKSIDQLADEIIIVASKKITQNAGQMSSIIKQVAAMDFAKPTWKAWTEADILGRLAKYGVNDKIMKAIQTMKDINITESVLRTIEKVQKIIKDDLMKSYRKAREVYKKLKEIIAYIKSMGNMDYDTWVAGLKTLALDNKHKVLEFVRKAYKASSEEVVTAFKGLEKLAKEEQLRISTLGKDYITIINRWSALIENKLQLVYNEVKPETIIVYQHYKNITSTFVRTQYNIIKSKVTDEYKKIYDQLTKEIGVLKAKAKGKIGELIKLLMEKIAELKSKFEQKFVETKDKIAQVYGELVTKYGGMTWEQIQEKLENVSAKIYEKVKTEFTMEYKKIMKKGYALQGEIVEKARGMFVKATAEYKNMVASLKKQIAYMKEDLENKYAKIKHTVIETYSKYEHFAKVETGKIIANVKQICDSVYNANKDKTVQQIFIEIRKFIIERYGHYRELVQAMGDKNFAKVTQLLNEAKAVVTDSLHKMFGINGRFMPELMHEIESVINQTLRNTVIMSKEVIKAVSPHIPIVKDTYKKFMNFITVRVPKMIKEIKASIRKDVEDVKRIVTDSISKVEIKLKELIDILKKNERFIIVQEKIAEMQKLLKKEIEKLKPVILRIQAVVKRKTDELEKLIKEKVAIIKDKPAVVEITKRIKEKVAELKKIAAAYKLALDELYKDLRIAEIGETVKQLRSSGKYTGGKIAEIIKQYTGSAISRTKQELKELTNVFRETVVKFADAPEDTFWTGVGHLKKTVINMFLHRKSLSEITSRLCTEIYKDAVAFGKDLFSKCTDKWTKETLSELYTQFKAVVAKLQDKLRMGEWKKIPAIVKAYLEEELKIVKAFVEGRVKLVKELIFTKIASIKGWSRYVVKQVYRFLESTPLKAIIDNRIWKEVADEIKTHELVLLSQDIIEYVVPILEKKCAQLKDNAIILYRKAESALKIAVVKTKEIMERARQLIHKIFGEMTIAEIADYIHKGYLKILMKVEGMKVKVIALIEKYTAGINKFVKQLKLKVGRIYVDVKRALITAIGKVKSELKVYITKVVEIYEKYGLPVKERLQKLVVYVIAKYKEVKVIVEAKCKEVTEKIVEAMKKVQKKILSLSGIQEKLAALKKMTIVEAVKALKDLYKTTIEKFSKFITRVEQLIKEVISKLIPTYKDLAEKIKIKSEMLKVKVMKELEPYMMPMEKVYRRIAAEIEDTAVFVYKYYHLQAKYNAANAYITKVTKETIMKYNIASRYITIETKRMLAEAKNTIVATTKNVEERYQQSRIFLTKEIARIMTEIPQVASALKKYVKTSEEAFKKTAATYGKGLKECVTKCVKRANKLKEYYLKNMEAFVKSFVDRMETILWRASDKTLRTVHSTLKYLNSINITLKVGELDLTFLHKDLIPSFKHQLSVIKKTLTVEQLRVKGAELLKKIQEKFAELKEAVKMYTEMVKKEAPVIIKKANEAIVKFVEKIKTRYPAMISKAKGLVKKNCAELMEKVKELISAIKKSDKFISLKKKLIEIREWIQLKIAELKKNPTLVKAKGKAEEMLKKIKEEVSVLKETLKKYLDAIKKRAPMVPGEVKEAIEKFIKTIKTQAPVLVKKAREYVVKRFEEVKEKILKLETRVKHFIATIKDSAKFKKVVAIIEAKLAEIKKWIKEKIGELKNNPTVMKVKEQANEIIKTIKIKIPDMVNKAREILETGIANAKEIIPQSKKILKDLIESVKKSNHLIVLQKKIAEFKKWIEAKIEELKKNPTLLKTKAKVEKMLKTFKMRLPEVITKVKESIKKYIKIVKEKTPQVVAKVKGLIKKYIELMEKQKDVLIAKVKEVLKRIEAKIEELKKNPKVVKVLTVGKEAMKKVISEIETIKGKLPEIVTKAKELLKKIGEKLKELVGKVETIGKGAMKKIRSEIETIKGKLPEIVTKAKELVKKIGEKLSELVRKVETIGKGAMKKIRSEIETIKGKIPEIVTKAKELLKKIGEKLRELVRKVETISKEAMMKIKSEIETIKGKFPKVATKVEELLKKIGEKLKELVKKVEPIGKEAMKKMRSGIETIKEKFPEMVTKAKELLKKIGQKVRELVRKVETISKEAMTKIRSEIETIKGKLPELVTKTKELLKKIGEKVRELVRKVETISKEAVKKIRSEIETIKGKFPEMVTKAKELLKKIREKVRELLRKVETKVKEVIPKLEVKLKDLIATIKNSDAFIKIQKKIVELLKNIKAKAPAVVAKVKETLKKQAEIVKKGIRVVITKVKGLIKRYIDLVKAKAPAIVKEANQILAKAKDLINKGVVKVKELEKRFKKWIKSKIEELKKNPIVLKIKAKITEILKKIKEEINSLEKKVKEEMPIVIARARRSVDDVVQRIIKEETVIMNKTDVLLKTYLPKIQQKLKDIAATIKKNKKFIVISQKIAEIREWIVKKLDELKVDTAELREEFVIIYKINRDIALRIYKDAVTYYKTMRKDAIGFIDTFVKFSRETCIKVIELYKFVSKLTMKELYNDITTYTKVLYNTLREKVKETYTQFKPIIEGILKELSEVAKKRVLAIKKALKSAYDDIISGVPVKEVLKPLFKHAKLIVDQVISQLKSLSRQLESIDITKTLCKYDQELCRLLGQAMQFYGELIKKYIGEVKYLPRGKIN